MKGRIKALVVAGAMAAGTLAVPFIATPASANHYCYAGTIVPISTPARTFYFHDRAALVGTGLVNPPGDDTEGTWLFMENGKKGGLQVGGEAIVAPLNGLGSDDPCPRDPAADDVVF